MSDKRYTQPPPKGEGLEDPKPGEADLTPEQWAAVMRADDEQDPDMAYDAFEVIEWLESRRTSNPKTKPKPRRIE